MATKKSSKTKKANSRRRKVKTSVGGEAQTIAELRKQLAESLQRQSETVREKVRYFEEQQARTRELEALYDVTTAASQSLELKPVFDEVVRKISEIFKFNSAGIYLLDAETQELHLQASFGMRDIAPRAFRRGQGLTGMVVETGQPIIFEDVQTDARYEQLSVSKSTRDHDYSFFAIFPIKAKGKFVGSINCLGKLPRKMSPQEIRLITSMSDQIGVAVENIHLYAELKGKTAELEGSNSQLREALEHQTATAEVLSIIGRSPTDVQPVLDAIVESAARVCGIDDLLLRLQEGNTLVARAHFGPIPVPRSRLEIGIDDTEFCWLREHGTLHIPDIDEQTDFQNLNLSGWRSFLAVPLRQHGELIGGLIARRMEARPFTSAQIKLLETFADQAVIALENVRLFQELKESLEQQTATSGILGVIASSPTDIQPVLDVVAQNAARLCDALDAAIYRIDGERIQPVAHCGPVPIGQAHRPLARTLPTGRAILDRTTVHIHDLVAVQETEFPDVKPLQPALPARTCVATPMLREGTAIGVIFIRRTEVRPFTDKQIKLLETFASQAVIAIENVRLFKELGERNAELREALEYQTATSEVLGIISRSAFDLQPVLDAVAQNAATLCAAEQSFIFRFKNGVLNVAVACNASPELLEFVQQNAIIPGRGSTTARAALERKTIHIPDILEDREYSYEAWQVQPYRSVLAVPMLKGDALLGVITVNRSEMRPFTEKQIELVTTFADQAVIAIENTRLLQELQTRNRDLTEALEQQTATSEVLRVIASSPTEIQPVLDILIANAVKLSGATQGHIRQYDGELLRPVAHYGESPEQVALLQGTARKPALENTTGRAFLERVPIHILDAQLEPHHPGVSLALRNWARTMLAVPLLREGTPIGVITIWRDFVEAFTDRQIGLVQTFADQAVIAIENVRLFQELGARTRDLARSVGELRALGEVGQAVSSTLDLQTVLSTIVRHAIQLSRTDGGVVYEYDEANNEFHLRASHLMEGEIVEALKATPVRPGQGATGQTATLRVPVQLPDISKEQEFTATRIRPIFARLGYRSVLAVPLLREERVLGALTVWRKQAGDFSPEIVNLLQTFATQSALAIQNARLFREIEDKSRQIEAANRHKSEFLANMSHELRTPLTAIIGFSEVLSDKIFGELNDKQDEYMGDIVSSGRHLLSLINDILDLSKVEAGRMELDVTRFDLPTAIDNALILIRERATRRGVKLEHTVDERLGEVVGDERKFKQILLNLLSNAIKFTAEGGSIGVAATLTKEAVEVAVSDTGVGIAPENHQTIFEEFRQVGTDASKKREGTGLGLTLTKKFVELHGGTIRVDSALGRGSTFTFTLPLNSA